MHDFRCAKNTIYSQCGRFVASRVFQCGDVAHHLVTAYKKFKPLDLDDIKCNAIKKDNIGMDLGDAGYEHAFQTFITLINKNGTQWTPLGYAAF